MAAKASLPTPVPAKAEQMALPAPVQVHDVNPKAQKAARDFICAVGHREKREGMAKAEAKGMATYPIATTYRRPALSDEKRKRIDDKDIEFEPAC